VPTEPKVAGSNPAGCTWPSTTFLGPITASVAPKTAHGSEVPPLVVPPSGESRVRVFTANVAPKTAHGSEVPPLVVPPSGGMRRGKSRPEDLAPSAIADSYRGHLFQTVPPPKRYFLP